MRRERDTDILDRAARKNWRVFTRAELLDLGLTPRQIRTMETRGQLHQIHRGIYIYGHPDVVWQGEYLAAQHAAGEGAYLTDGSALAVARLWRPYTRQIHLTTLSNRRSRDGIVMHRTNVAPEPDEIRTDGPLRYAALPRLFLEFAPASNEKQLNGLIEKAVQQDKLDHALMRTVLERHRGRPGSKVVEAAYAGYLKRPRARSELELAFDRQRAARPSIPEPEHNVYVMAGGIRWELDRFWREHGLAVEVDSRTYHQALKDRAKDEIKRAKLLTVGIQTMSVSDWRMEYDICDCLDDIEKIIALEPQPLRMERDHKQTAST